MPKIPNEQLKEIFESEGSQYPLFKESVKMYNDLRVHADGEFPAEMITRRRPSETEEILQYREQTYKAITKEPLSKVISSFGKIRRSPDWSINFPKDIPKKIIEGETLEEYCNENLVGYGSITDWAFGILLKQNLIDANALIAVIPVGTKLNNEYAKPVPIVFNSNQIIQFDERNQYCILRSKVHSGSATIFYYIDELEIIGYQRTKDGIQIIFEHANSTGLFPVFKVKSESYRQYDSMILNKSRLDAMVPFLDEAACEYSDYKGSKIQYLYPLMWYFRNKNCTPCSGTGKIPTKDGAKICAACDGEGKVKFSPFAHMAIDPAELGKQANPIPPAGFVARDIAILELQEKSVDKNNFRALAAINMQFLDQTPLSISGDAKNVDREELNNTVYNFAEDLVATIDKVIYFINEWRYGYFIGDKNIRMAMLPNIPVPQNFDLLPEDYLMKEVTDARTAKINPLLIATLEEQLAVKKFYNKPDLATNIKLYFDLDPLPGVSVDEKMTLISNKAITQEDFIISSYMGSFIKRAIRENPDFSKFEYPAQMAILVKYAKEKSTANDAAAQMIDAQKKAIINEMNQQQNQQQQVPQNQQ